VKSSRRPPLDPFVQSPSCRKCLAPSYLIRRHWYPKQDAGSRAGFQGEKLVLTCDRCGYVWRTLPATLEGQP
jgi:hypothetical protein